MSWLPESPAVAESAVWEAAPSSILTRLASGWSPPKWSPFCRLVGREAEADAWAASRWSGLAATGAEREDRRVRVGSPQETRDK